jgi:hypothetical protein
MAETDFINQVTTIEASWLNNVDEMVNGALGGTPTVAAVLAALGISAAAGLTLPLGTAYGGTGATTAAAGLAALGGTTLAAVEAEINNTYLGNQLYPVISIEGSSVVQPWYPYGSVDRYQVNTNPGVTDMSAGVQAAITVAQTLVLLGQSGIPVSFQWGAYLINTPPTITPSGSNLMLPLHIRGTGLGTILYCGATGTQGLLKAFSGAYYHDFQIVSAAGTTNNGICIETASGSQPIGFLIERVYSRMQGVGFLLANCNSGTIRNCWHWNDKAPTLPIAISAAGASVNHGIYMTGTSGPGTGFVNDLSIYDFQGATSQNYTAGQRWIKGDADNLGNIRIYGGLATNESSGVAQKMLELGSAAGGSHVQAAWVIGVSHEGGFLEINNGIDCTIGGCYDDGIADFGGVSINIQNNSVANTILPNNEAGALAFDAGSGTNTIIGGTYLSFADSANTPNYYLSGANRSAGAGGILEYSIAYAASMTPNCALGNYGVITVTSNTNLTINAPLNPFPGARHSLKFRNTSGGAMGSITWNAVFKVSPTAFVKPGNGSSSTIDFVYSELASAWVQDADSGDVPN